MQITQDQIETTRDFLLSFKEYIERTEPQAEDLIDSIEEVLQSLPESAIEMGAA